MLDREKKKILVTLQKKTIASTAHAKITELVKIQWMAFNAFVRECSVEGIVNKVCFFLYLNTPPFKT